MRASPSALILCAIGVPAAPSSLAQIEARQGNFGSWHLIGFQPNCGSFGCNTDYAIFGGPDAVSGAPAFGLRVSI
ncbi:hypothetical protein F5Y07DRAFT_371743, partial [Xylaria sp. FL0933]